MRFDQSAFNIAGSNQLKLMMLVTTIGTLSLVSPRLGHQVLGQETFYSPAAGYAKPFNPYQQVGLYSNESEGESYPAYSTMNDQSASQISHEYIDRQRQHGKYAREGYVNGETPFDNVFKNVLNNTWIRLEYLNWSIKGPGDKLLGASTNLTNADPANPYIITVLNNGFFVDATTSVPSAGSFDLPSNNGFRGSMGIDLEFGELEASSFVLSQAKSTVDFSHFINDSLFLTRVISQTYLEQGQVSNLAFNYDVGYEAAYTSQIFGADANLHYDIRNVDLGLNHDVLAGFRFIHLSERLQQRGRFDDFGTIPVVTVEYDSSTRNNIYGPQVGFRSEFKHQMFTVGVQNKVMLGLNHLEASLDEVQFDAVNGGFSSSSSNDSTQFAAAYDLGVYGKIKVSPHFHINVGYNFLWVGRVSRPADNIIYDTDSTGAIASQLQVNNADFFVHGLSLGTEINF